MGIASMFSFDADDFPNIILGYFNILQNWRAVES